MEELAEETDDGDDPERITDENLEVDKVHLCGDPAERPESLQRFNYGNLFMRKQTLQCRGGDMSQEDCGNLPRFWTI